MNEYEVEQILDVRFRRKHKEYLVRWKGYDSSEDSWVSEKNLNCDALLNDFLKKVKNPPKPEAKIEFVAIKNNSIRYYAKDETGNIFEISETNKNSYQNQIIEYWERAYIVSFNK